MRFFSAAAISILLASCASGYKSFYKPIQGVTPDAIAAIRAAPPPKDPTVERGQPVEGSVIYAAYGKRGYVPIGYSAFNSGRAESEPSAIDQGRRVGADLVLILNPQYTGTVATSVPITTPTTSTSYTTGTATAYGSGGSASAYGSSTTTTYGSQTNYIPMSVDRSNYGAVYFIKRNYTLGVQPRDLSDQERQQFQTNQGVMVMYIVDNTPAFFADILPGDVISRVDDVAASNSMVFSDLLSQSVGKKVKIDILRGSQQIQKSVQLSSH